MARGLFEEWFVRFRFPGHETVHILDTPDGPLPEGWERTSLLEAFDFRSGKTIGKQDRSGGSIPVFGANGVIGWTSRSPLTSKAVVIGKIGSCGSYHRADDPAYVSNNAFIVEPREDFDFEFMAATLKAVDWTPYIGGSANPYMPEASFSSHSVVWPFTKLRRMFNEMATPLAKQVRLLKVSERALIASRDLLLPRLISGQLSVEAAETELEAAA